MPQRIVIKLGEGKRGTPKQQPGLSMEEKKTTHIVPENAA